MEKTVELATSNWGRFAMCVTTGEVATVADWGRKFGASKTISSHCAAAAIHKACKTNKPWRGLLWRYK